MSSFFRRQLADYVEYHRAPWNCAMHVFGIVFLFLAAVLPLSQWSIAAFGIQTSVAAIATIPVLIYLTSRLEPRSLGLRSYCFQPPPFSWFRQILSECGRLPLS